jgi:hypothetical protein
MNNRVIRRGGPLRPPFSGAPVCRQAGAQGSSTIIGTIFTFQERTRRTVQKKLCRKQPQNSSSPLGACLPVGRGED